VNHEVLADEFARQTRGVGCDFAAPWILGGKSQQSCRGDSGWKNSPSVRAEFLDRRGIGSALSKDRFAASVINPFAETLDGSRTCKARQGLSDGRQRQIPKILESPQTLTTT
jgi:hypothetical protein